MSFLSKILPGSLKEQFSKAIQFKIIEPTLRKRLGRIYGNPASVIKYIPYNGDENYVLPYVAIKDQKKPVPPQSHWLGYGKTGEEYINSGKEDVKFMHERLASHGYTERQNQRVLDLGCGAARMLRNVNEYFKDSELWGLDINANMIYWCKENLGDAANFATTTLTPHLSFESNYFNLVYCGSVFTHIDDLAEAWLLEIRRVLKKGAIFYVTIQDESTVNLLETEFKEHALAVFLHKNATYMEHRRNFGMLVIERDNLSYVFFSKDYFKQLVAPTFEVLEIINHAYGFQTGYVLRKK